MAKTHQKAFKHMWLFVILCIAAPLTGLAALADFATGDYSLGTLVTVGLVAWFTIYAVRLAKRVKVSTVGVVFAAIFSIAIIVLIPVVALGTFLSLVLSSYSV